MLKNSKKRPILRLALASSYAKKRRIWEGDLLPRWIPVGGVYSYNPTQGALSFQPLNIPLDVPHDSR